MKEFMLLIRNEGDGKAAMSSEQQLAFIKKCEVYIGQLQSRQQLIAAQPLAREGMVLSKPGKDWIAKHVDIAKEIQVGYYHILANNITEAISIAKDNPEFEYVASASIEVRPVKTKEVQTAFVYPTK